MSQTVIARPLPTGGCCALSFLNGGGGTWTISRAQVISSIIQTYVPLYSGSTLQPDAALPASFLDLGDGFGQPIIPGATYIYKLVTNAGTSLSSQVTLPLGFNIRSEVSLAYANAGDPTSATEYGYLFLVKRLLSASYQNITMPNGWVSPTIMISMPLSGQPTLPMISVNPDMEQQTFLPIGANVPGVDEPVYSIDFIMKRRYRISILCLTPEEREFHKSAVLTILNVSLATVLQPYGQSLSHSFQMASSQWNEPAPGFYFTEIMLEFEGNYCITVQNNDNDFVTIGGFDIDINGE